MKWSFVCVVLSLALSGCANNSGPSHSHSQAGRSDYVKSGVIDIPGYSMETKK